MFLLDEREFIENQLESQGIGIYDFYDHRQVFDMATFCDLALTRRSEILLIDTQTVLNQSALIEKCKAVMNTFLGVIFFHTAEDERSKKWVDDHAGHMNKIIGSISFPVSPMDWTILTNQLQFCAQLIEDQKALQRHLVKFSQELDNALETAEIEMFKAKKIHEMLVPKRVEEIKGLQFMNKYAAGDGGSTEFYDLIQSGPKIYQVLISCQSYLISSALIGLLNIHKQKDFSPSSFLIEANKEIETINSSKKKKSHVDVTLIEIDSTQLSLKFHNPGQMEMWSRQNGKIDLTKDYQMKKDEQFFLLSSGFISNWNEHKAPSDINLFIKNHHQSSQREFLLELFLQMSQKKNSDFLSKDATVVMMEVNRHVIQKV